MMRMMALATFLLSTAVAHAGDLAYTPPPPPEVPGAGHLLVRLFVLTGFVLAICLGLLWFSRRLQRGGQPGAKSGDLDYVAALPLNNRCALHLLTAGGQAVVVGTDPGGLKAMLVLPASFEAALRAAGAD